VGKIEASYTVEIEAPMERVYEIAADIPSSVGWTPSVEGVDVIEKHPDGSTKLAEIEANAVVKKTKSVIRYDYDPPDRISWEQESGYVKSLTGDWKLVAIDDRRTRATYSLIADPGRMLGMLLRGPVEGKVKEFLTKGAAEGLKEQAESGA
jgi:uncharacterized membrane protein